MDVRKQDLKKSSASCNFCKKGELTKNGMGIVYPYETVYTFRGETSGLVASICEECLEELYTKAMLKQLK